MASLSGKMGELTKENFSTIKDMVKVNSAGQMAVNILAVGLKESNMEKVFTSEEIVPSSTAYGAKVNLKNG